jgi:ribosomal-protein-alanine N-acetyltransferase
VTEVYLKSRGDEALAHPRGKILIRRARVADLDRLVSIEKRSFRTHRLVRKDFEYHLRNRSSILLVAEVSGKVVGYITGIIYHGAKNRIAKLYSMAVLSPWRRRRVGSFLLKSFEKEMVGRDSTSITLEVRRSNRSAQALYSAFGYDKEKVLKDYYGPRGDGLRMRKSFPVNAR